jgi:hypothetical protein
MFAFRRRGYKRESASGVFTPREHMPVGPALSAQRAAIVPPDLNPVGGDEGQQHDAERQGDAAALSQKVHRDPEHERGRCWATFSPSDPEFARPANWR